MTDEQFCKLYSGYYGEPIDKVAQLTMHQFTGEELKEFIEYVIEGQCIVTVTAEDLSDAQIKQSVLKLVGQI